MSQQALPSRGGQKHSNQSMQAAARLRALLQEPGCHTLLGCYDCISAKAIVQAGFRACFMSGFAVSASRLGMPDVGLCTYNEMVETASNICRCVGGDACVIGDGDTGYGGLSNLRRTVEGYAAAGLAGITIEDQVFPKRCAYAKGVEVVTRTQAIQRLRAALLARDEMRARNGLDLVIVGRTDVRRCSSLDPSSALEEAITRCVMFEELGADIVYAEGLQGVVEARALHSRLKKSTPTMLAQVERAGVQTLSAEDAGGMGFKLCLFGVSMLNAHFSVARNLATGIKSGMHPQVGQELAPLEDLHEAVGFEAVYSWEERASSSQSGAQAESEALSRL